jgi:hypothetical protein
LPVSLFPGTMVSLLYVIVIGKVRLRRGGATISPPITPAVLSIDACNFASPRRTRRKADSANGVRRDTTGEDEQSEQNAQLKESGLSTASLFHQIVRSPPELGFYVNSIRNVIIILAVFDL